ncbi:hypothetical protein TDIS_1036 [Thermosulfurimonas dismutans]|uniref:Glycoside-hydrolase family GH114 TIM-barrel domain-containing protein n=1 Tax=Thermosulfurimonas dismutans TaxID=999894 RepID=A0A179D5B2_9BACT|nr:hypothetical protein TDIS_1036 [Thermosulfurimonas dismutans]
MAYAGECKNGPECIPDGDVAPQGSRDGQVNIGDAVLALRFALGLEIVTEEDRCHADVAPLGKNQQPNPDGQIIIGDALVILRKALGLIDFGSGKEIWKPAPGTTWQWQLTGEIDTSVEAEMFDVDLFGTPVEVIQELHRRGRKVICYFSAGTYEPWRPDASKFSEEVLGKPLKDWPDERWLDIRRLDLLGPIMKARLDLAVEKGCDGVEPDNVDAYQNDSGFPLTYEDQLLYNRWLAEEAHRRGLSVGLKNDLDQIPDLESYFDWALNEECFSYNECEKLLPFVNNGKAVFGVEYELDPADFCARANQVGFSFMKKRLDLDAWRLPCW